MTRREEYTALLARMEVRPGWRGAIDKAARTIIANRKRYEAVEATTGVPWALIGALHWRESTGSFATHLHNGDPLTARTNHVPSGRPLTGRPPFKWEESAIDALTYDKVPAVEATDLEGICDIMERFNGLGYRSARTGVNSPYLWSGTNLYTRGKFKEIKQGGKWRGVFQRDLVDAQIGAVPLYLRVMEIAQHSVVRRASRKITLLERVVTGLKGLLTLITGLFTADNLGYLQSWFGIDTIPWSTLLALALAAIGVWVLANWLIRLSLEDNAKGNYTPSGLDPHVVDAITGEEDDA